MIGPAAVSLPSMGRTLLCRVGVPRLLPVTICLLAVVLTSRSVLLVRSAIVGVQSAVLITTARASGPPAPAGGAHGEKPAAKSERPVEPPKAAEKPQIPDGPPAVTEGERAVLLELRQRRQDLEGREATLASRESILVAAEKKLSARVGELQSLQQRLETLDAGRKQQEEAAWQGLVKVYESMKPRDAGAIFNELGMPVLLAVVGRMKETKAAAILAAMTPDKARDVTTQLALTRTQGTDPTQSGGKPALSPGPGKAAGSGT